jgi:hypothetical protein
MRTWQISIEMDQKREGCGGVNSINAVQDMVHWVCCEHGNESYGSLKGGNFFAG